MKNSERPAHPATDLLESVLELDGQDVIGLTKREYFAAMAMQGLMVQAIAGNHNINDDFNNHYRAKFAVDMADELLKQLEE